MQYKNKFDEKLGKIVSGETTGACQFTAHEATYEEFKPVIAALKDNKEIYDLRLSTNHLGPQGAADLAEITTIISLDLGANKIGNVAETLAEVSHLTSLGLAGNDISVDVAKKLAKNTFLSHLNLDTNSLGDKGVIPFGENKTLTSLSVAHNGIGSEGAMALAKSTTLTSLNVMLNNISDDGKEVEAIAGMLKRNRQNAQQFLDASKKGELTTLQTMLTNKQVSPYCHERTYKDTSAFCLPAKDDTKHTALHLAVINKHQNVVTWLVQKYPTLLNMRDKDGKSPLMLAQEQQDQAMSDILTDKGTQDGSGLGTNTIFKTHKDDEVVPSQEKTSSHMLMQP